MDWRAPSLRGRLLVATPPLVDPNFDRAVVLVLEHTDDGALGIVLNRPSDTTIDDVFPEWHAIASDPACVFTGGPVSPDAVIALARGKGSSETDGWVSIDGDLGTVDLARDPLDLGVALDALRVFVGYAGWSAGQLEGELAQGGWFVVRPEPNDPFATDPDGMWRRVLRRQRSRVAIFAQYPDDAGLN